MTAADLVSQGYGGYQGWDDAGAAADFAKTGGSGKKTSGGASSSGSSSGSSNSVDLNSLPSIADYTSQAYAPADQALSAYVMAMRNQKNPLDIYNSLETASGLPQLKNTATTLQGNIGNLEDTIKRVEPNVSATTGGSLVTEAQRQGMVTARQKPLLQNLGDLTTGLGRVQQGISAATADLGTKTNLAIQGQAQELKPYEVQVTALQDKAARLVSGFTADSQNKLQTLLAQWNRNNTLTDQQTTQAFDLLTSQNSYDNEIKKMQEQAKVDLQTYKDKKAVDNANNGGNVDLSSFYGDSSDGNSNTISNLWNMG